MKSKKISIAAIVTALLFSINAHAGDSAPAPKVGDTHQIILTIDTVQHGNGSSGTTHDKDQFRLGRTVTSTASQITAYPKVPAPTIFSVSSCPSGSATQLPVDFNLQHSPENSALGERHNIGNLSV